MNKIIRITCILLFSCFIWGTQVKGQCLSKSDFDFELIEGKQLVVNFSNYEGTISDVEFSLYDYNKASFYKSVSISSTNSQEVIFNKDLQSLTFKNIPTGDYLLVVKKSFCDDIYLGKDFSGFPYSGLRID